jgi:hypothetical protein
MWDAVGRTNGVLHQVLPLASIGTPIDVPRVEGGDMLASAVLCGDRAVLVIVANREFTATPDSFTLQPRTVAIRARVPRFFKPLGVARISFPEGPQDVETSLSASSVSFSCRVVDGGVFVIYSDERTLSEMEAICAEHREQFEPACPSVARLTGGV